MPRFEEVACFRITHEYSIWVVSSIAKPPMGVCPVLGEETVAMIPWAFLVVTIIGATFAFNTYLPQRRTGPLCT